MPYPKRFNRLSALFVHKPVLSVLTAGLLALTPLFAQSLPDDSRQPINIQSDRAAQKVLKDGSEKTEYFGKVVITQGSMKINGEHIIIHSKNRKVVKITAIGEPARFQQRSDPKRPPMKAKAHNINYQLAKDTIVLAKNAIIEQNGNTVSGERIEYNVASEKVNASRGAGNNTRVHMVLTPAGKQESN